MSLRLRYWSCSKIADWVRGAPKPGCATSKGWNDWNKKAKTAHPIRYWVVEEMFDRLQNFVSWPWDIYNTLRYHINNRWVDRTHLLDCRLEKGRWHEYDTRLLHGAFEGLVDFVEIQQAMHHYVCSKENEKKYNMPWYRRRPLQLGVWRSPESGMDYLNWASTLTNDHGDNPDQLTPQALAARETISLYHWWKDVRPLRRDPMDLSGWSEWCERRRENLDEDDYWGDWSDQTTEERTETHRILEISNEIEQQQQDEDTEMLIRLVRLRERLWT
jgi:hypothetical protein